MNTILLSTFLPSLFFLLGFFLLTLSNACLEQFGRLQSKERIRSLGSLSFYLPILLKKAFPKREWEALRFCLSFSKNVYLIAYAITAFNFALFNSTEEFLSGTLFLKIAGPIIGIALLCELIAKPIGLHLARASFRLFAPLSFLYLILLSPISLSLIKLIPPLLAPTIKGKKGSSLSTLQLKEAIQDLDWHQHLDQSDHKLITSFLNFKDRVAKEIMVPRVDLFSLSSETSIREAIQLFVQEGYSRIPIYREKLDQIIGVVLYKDLLKYFAKEEPNLDVPLETIAKPVLYSPETKKVSQLLQEFRSKQIHMAIIVDEYGGTEGVVTIEDILEELVGEIEDEYDIDEETPFFEIPGGGWMVDAKMTLLDIADQIGIHIPTHPEYETLGGFVFHFAGTIPSKGWTFSHDKFDLEVISSNERAIKTIKIIPREPTSSFQK